MSGRSARKRLNADGTVDFPGFVDAQPIAQGGISTIYRARELDTDRIVALKLLNLADLLPHTIESFEQEARALGPLSGHPNIVTLFRTFRVADGRPVLVLELCRGSLADQAQTSGGTLDVRTVVAAGVKVSGALESAHRAGLLHRDVKPQNVLVTAVGEPALADFGVARLQTAGQSTAGVFGFTTLHAPPELLEGGATSPATDVYELASTLYQLLAGQGAYTTFDDEPPASIVLRILRDPVPPLLVDGVPIALSDLLVWAMAKDPAARPQSARQFGEELRRVQFGEGWPLTDVIVLGDPGASLEVNRTAPPRQGAPRAVPPPVPAPRPGMSPSAASPGVTAAAPAPPRAAPPPAPSAPAPAPPSEPAPWTRVVGGDAQKTIIPASFRPPDSGPEPPEPAPPPARRRWPRRKPS